ncbi:hypothetical protein [Poritiphilus flavus]|uniref:Uncharacterized protein n=1 Tax=Poritiphilus flavus TaxID=2697053 RepID=A0A6L9EEV9_9FLAO|nr:hypothetical protein [Poritiphilus flavus]NAS13193.1 hypothetical protein [Poritiphilus flavus]
MQTIVKHFIALLLLLLTQFVSDSDSETYVAEKADLKIEQSKQSLCYHDQVLKESNDKI